MPGQSAPSASAPSIKGRPRTPKPGAREQLVETVPLYSGRMSGEAGIPMVSEWFSLFILSGVPVFDPQGALPVERRLRERFLPKLPALAQAVEAMRVELALAPFERDARYEDAPAIADTVIEDRPDEKKDPFATTPTWFRPDHSKRATLHLHARTAQTGEGFNLTLHVTARVRRTRLDALARAIGALLFPGEKLRISGRLPMNLVE
jgi:hypothetical protein